MKLFWRYLFPPLYSLMIYYTIRAVNDITEGERFWDRPWELNLGEVVGAVLVSYTFRPFFHWLERRLLRQETTTEVTPRLVAYELLVALSSIVLLVNGVIVPIIAVTDDGLSLADFVQANVIVGLYLLLYFAVRRGNHYIQAYVQSRVQLQQVEQELLKAELEFLRAQFSPHFLFNGLNNIYFQMDVSVPEAKHSVEKLSELLRYQLYQDHKQPVPLAREEAFIQTYVAVNRLRRSQELRVSVTPTGADTPVYPHLFLPLVENAFKYVEGDAPFVEMTWQWVEGALQFDIRNRCRPGMAPRPEGIGLRHLQRRLDLLYPQRHTLHTQAQGDVFTASLTLLQS